MISTFINSLVTAHKYPNRRRPIFITLCSRPSKSSTRTSLRRQYFRETCEFPSQKQYRNWLFVPRVVGDDILYRLIETLNVRRQILTVSIFLLLSKDGCHQIEDERPA